jgi:hypothetical protein
MAKLQAKQPLATGSTPDIDCHAAAWIGGKLTAERQ